MVRKTASFTLKEMYRHVKKTGVKFVAQCGINISVEVPVCTYKKKDINGLNVYFVH